MRMLRRMVWLALALSALAGCGAQHGLDPGSGGSLPALGELDGLKRGVSDTTPQVSGADFIASSGILSAYSHPTQATWLVLDGDADADGTAWAVWRVTLSAGQIPQSIDVNLPQNGQRRYWIAYADFGTEHWHFLDTGGNALGQQGAGAHIEPVDANQMLSENLNMYVAVLVRGGQSPSSLINVGYLTANYTPAAGIDPILDDFENNDTLDTCYQLPGAGMYHASIHESRRTDMSDSNEFRDKYDIYCIDIPPGTTCTATLRHEVFDHFTGGGLADLSLVVYQPGAGGVLDNYELPNLQGVQVAYGFQQIYLSGFSGHYEIGVLPDLGDSNEDNAEYDLGIFYNSNPHSVSGHLTQNGLTVDKRFTVFLEPGNFNDVTWYDGSDPPGSRGDFVIQGVPDGDYTMKVQGSWLDHQEGYIYTTTMPVTVSGGNVTGADLDIEPYGGP